MSKQWDSYIESVISVHPDYVYPSNGNKAEKDASFVEFAKYLEEINGMNISELPNSKTTVIINKLNKRFAASSENKKQDEIKPKADSKAKPKADSKAKPKADSKKASTKAKPKKETEAEEQEQPEAETQAEEQEQAEEQPEAETQAEEQEQPKQKAFKKIQRNASQKQALQVKPKDENLLEFEKPEFEVISFEDEQDSFNALLTTITDSFDYSKGKRTMKTKKSAQETEESQSEEQLKELCKESLELIKSQYDELYESTKQFEDDNKDGNLRITEGDIKIVFPAVPKSKSKAKNSKDSKAKTEKKDDLKFDKIEEWKSFRKTQDNIFKFISKDFVSEHYLEILKSGILSSRSIIKTSCYGNTNTLDKIGMMSKININVCESLPVIKIKLLKQDEHKYLKDYYWLITNANYTSTKTMKASDVFERRNAIIMHPRYKELNIKELWNQAREEIKNNDSELAKIWLEILNSEFMFDIIIYGIEMNPYVYPCFKRLINESSELFRNELISISFMFTCFCLGPISSESLKDDLEVNDVLYDYDSFAFVSKVIDSDINSVIDIKLSENDEAEEADNETENEQ